MLAVLLLESPYVIIFFIYIITISVLFMLDTLLSINGTKFFIYYYMYGILKLEMYSILSEY